MAWGVILSKDKQNAESILEAFSTKSQKILIQKFIPEAGGADIRVFIVGGRNCWCNEKTKQNRVNLDQTYTEEVIHL